VCVESLAAISEGLRVLTQEAMIAVHSCECKRESVDGALECTCAFASDDEALKKIPTGPELCKPTHLMYMAELAPRPGQSDGVVYGRLLRAQTILDLGSRRVASSEWFSKVELVGTPAFFLRTTQYSKWAVWGTLKVDYAPEVEDERLVLRGKFSADVAIYHAICRAAPPGWGGFRSGACLQPTSLAVKRALGDASDGAYVCLVSTLAAALSLPLDNYRAKCDAARMATTAHRQMARYLQIAMASQRKDAMERARTEHGILCPENCTDAVCQTAAAITAKAKILQAPALRQHVDCLVSCLLTGEDMAALGSLDVYSATLERHLAWSTTGSIDDSALVLLLELRLLAILGGTPPCGEPPVKKQKPRD